MKTGRPSDYSEELSARICEQLALGKSVRTITLDESMPCMSTVFKWLREKEEFLQQYEKAKQEACDLLFEEIIDIADDSSRDLIETENGTTQNTEVLQRSRLRVDTRKWALSKLKPKKYGDRVETVHSGHLAVGEITDAQLQSEVNKLIEKMKG